MTKFCERVRCDRNLENVIKAIGLFITFVRNDLQNYKNEK